MKYGERNLWAFALEDLRKANLELVENFSHCLSIKNEIGDGSKMEDLALKAFLKIEETKNSKQAGGSSAKVRKHFEQIIKIIIASKDFISAAAAENPYAATVWTGVCFILPVSKHARSFPL